MKEKMKEAGRLYSESSRLCVLTGAGVSAESGIPTFRGEDGLWKNYNATDLATMGAFKSDPKLVWEWYQWRRGLIRKCSPNPSHAAIRDMEREKEEFLLITQNVDGFHRMSGNKKLVEIHGNIWEVKCLSCGAVSLREEDFQTLPPECPECEGVLRPNVVWFGESIPSESIDKSISALTRSDLVIVAGTSGHVQPAASFARVAAESGARVIEVNIEPTPNYESVDIFILGKTGEFLPLLLKQDGR